MTAKGRARDPNRQYVFDPRLSLIAFLVWITSDPLKGACLAENRRQQITHRQVFDLFAAICGLDISSPQKATYLTTFAYIFTIISTIRRRGVQFRQMGKDCGRSYNARLYEMTAGLSDPRAPAIKIWHVNPPILGQRNMLACLQSSPRLYRTFDPTSYSSPFIP
jgi:hypothetical protein